ncbi:hypothetical protein [Tropicimonas sediminicola]|uniref:Uncharacterized protein n=1 Tax=Tropicimonas sediminicola TaxID=1031541 RepID=A0A239HMF8_9RHOB|nr:hypothetical protein [Tropicimonas sediminicola]SNS82576.1 hypothetical protein SAMN05421757_103501 [Tropicimonas sediminicola]
MSVTSHLADELLALAKRANAQGLTESSRQITLAAGLVLAEAGDQSATLPQEQDSIGPATPRHGNVVPFPHSTIASGAPLPRHTKL